MLNGNSISQENLWKVSNLKTLNFPQKLYNFNLFQNFGLKSGKPLEIEISLRQKDKQNETQVAASWAQV